MTDRRLRPHLLVLIKRSPSARLLPVDNVEVIDPAGLARYAAAAAPSVAAHGGRYLAVAATPEVVEGDPTLYSAVLIEFPT